TLALALYALGLFLERPTASRGVGLGVAGALAVLSKFSAIPFFFAGALAIVVVRGIVGRRADGEPRTPVSAAIGRTVLAVGVAAVVLWAGYRFSWGPIPESVGPRSRDVVVGPGARATSGPAVPAPELFEGLRLLRSAMHVGHPAYLLGQYSQTGWWYYFPVAVVVKTPIPFL